MKKAIALILSSLVLVAGLLAGGGALWQTLQLQQAAGQLRQQVAAAQQEAQRLEGELEKQQAELAGMQAEYQSLAAENGQAAEKLARYQQLLDAVAQAGPPAGEHFRHYQALLDGAGLALYDRMQVSFLQGITTVQVPTQEEMAFDDVFDIYVGLLLDDPGLFQFVKKLRGTYGGAGGNTIQPELHFSGGALEGAKAAFEAEAEAVVQAAAGLGGDVAKVKYVHDYLAGSVSYDEGNSRGHEAYGAMVDKRAVCDGYAMAFKYYMNRLGIPAACVTGSADGEEHAWNLVMLEGEYYNVDVTWDDPVWEVPPGVTPPGWIYDYFLVSDAVLGRTHTRSEFSARLPACTSTRYEGVYVTDYAA